MLLAVACLSHAPYVFGETRTPGSGVMPPKELELLIIAVGVEIRAGRIQAKPTNWINLRGRHPAVYGSCSSSHMSRSPRRVHLLSGDIPAPLITSLDSGSWILFERLLGSLSKRQI